MEDPKEDLHRAAVGGFCDAVGKRQLDFLIEQGLKPNHYLLDVGCGSLRAGVHFIKYLLPKHYFGIDINKKLLDAGKDIEIPRYNLQDREPTLMQTDNFDFVSLNQKFDYAIAQSVFTHLPLNSIIICMMKMEKVLVKGGRFYATFFENPDGKFNLEPKMRRSYAGEINYGYFDRNPYHYDLGTFHWICEGTSLKVAYIGNWGHPVGPHSMMVVFTKT